MKATASSALQSSVIRWQDILEAVNLGQESFVDSFLVPETGSILGIDQHRSWQEPEALSEL